MEQRGENYLQYVAVAIALATLLLGNNLLQQSSGKSVFDYFRNATSDQIIALAAAFLVTVLFCVVVLRRVSLGPRKGQGLRSTKHLLGARSPQPYEVRYVTEGELVGLWQRANQVYQDDTTPLDVSREWFRVYPRGFMVMSDDKWATIAAVGIWPVKEGPFREFLAGKRRERDLAKNSIVRLGPEQTCSNWYISGINMTSRKSKLLPEFIRQSFKKWIESKNVSEQPNIVALAWDCNGENLLRNFEFSKHRDKTETADKMAIYMLEGKSLGDLRGLVERRVRKRPVDEVEGLPQTMGA